MSRDNLYAQFHHTYIYPFQSHCLKCRQMLVVGMGVGEGLRASNKSREVICLHDQLKKTTLPGLKIRKTNCT